MILALVELTLTLALLRLAGWLLVVEPFTTLDVVSGPDEVRRRVESANHAFVQSVRTLGWFLFWATVVGVTDSIIHLAASV